MHEFNGREYPMAPGSCHAIVAEDWHRLWPVNCPQIIIHNFAFDPSLLTDTLKPEGAWFGDVPERISIQFTHGQMNMIDSLYQMFCEAEGDLISTQAILHTFKTLILTQKETPNSGPPWIGSLRIQMMDHANLQQGLNAMVDLSGKSKEHLCRQWKKAFNETPTQFINQQRLQHAKRLLLTTDMTTSEIAYEVGFGDISHFYRLFNKQYGQPPSQFARNYASQHFSTVVF